MIVNDIAERSHLGGKAALDGVAELIFLQEGYVGNRLFGEEQYSQASLDAIDLHISDFEDQGNSSYVRTSGQRKETFLLATGCR